MHIIVSLIGIHQYKCDETGSKSKLANILKSMIALSEMIILCWLFITSRFPFDYIA